MNNPFIGLWKLIEMNAESNDGDKIFPIGKIVEGLLIYTESGYMSAQLGSLARTRFQNQNYRIGQPSEIIEAFNGYISYFGKYRVNEDKHYIVHSISQSLFPNWIGENVKRFYEFDGNKLILKAPKLLYDNVLRTPTLIWERIQ